ncbi:MAG: hypothetical protein E6G45_03410 [Actinobacteria bacterium]|nr:MAG: hypothetical protein E6G45_03410 [Actinomycetota bacterium]
MPVARSAARPGRSCPRSYFYGPQALAGEACLSVDSLWVAGGLYGNPFALDALLEAYDREGGAKALVFNGDFHWFDVDPPEFERIDAAVLGFHALRGNVETELAVPGADAGCGCGYPDWVDDATVERSNRILERLRATAQRRQAGLRRLAALPMHTVARIGNERVAVVHGDYASLAGWGFSQEVLLTAEGLAAADQAFDQAQVKVFASSHSCLPVLQSFARDRVLINNGAAGMPNFRGELFGLATRIAVSPSAEALYLLRCGELFVEAVPLRYDADAWESSFLRQWPAGSDAHISYYLRMTHGPQYSRAQALRTTPRCLAARP